MPQRGTPLPPPRSRLSDDGPFSWRAVRGPLDRRSVFPTPNIYPMHDGVWLVSIRRPHVDALRRAEGPRPAVPLEHVHSEGGLDAPSLVPAACRGGADCLAHGGSKGAAAAPMPTEGPPRHARWDASWPQRSPAARARLRCRLPPPQEGGRARGARLRPSSPSITAHLRLVTHLAKRYQHLSELPLRIFVQEGMLGLLRAAETFDATQGYRFATYAGTWIRRSIGHALVARGTTNRLPARIAADVSRYKRTWQTLTRPAAAQPPTLDALAAALAWTRPRRSVSPS